MRCLPQVKTPMKKSALILIDLQNDFMPQGALPVPDAETIIPIINQVIHQFDFVVATQNWYPKNHLSFASHYPKKKPGASMVIGDKKFPLWPDHCIQETPGAELSSALDSTAINHILRKGMKSDLYNHSAFFEQDAAHATGLHTLLKFNKIKKVYISGLSIDHSIEHTALDAINLGYQVYLLTDACRSLTPQAENDALHYSTMSDTKVKLINTSDLHTMPQQLAFSFYDE